MAPIAKSFAYHFNIKVPVRLYKTVQGVGKAKVFCEALTDSNVRIGSNYKWSNKHANTYGNGNLSEDILIQFNANPGKDPNDATKYKCDLKIQLAWASPPFQTPSQTTNSMYLKAKPGTPFKVEVSGPLYKNFKKMAPQIKNPGMPIPSKPGFQKPNIKSPGKFTPQQKLPPGP